VRNFSKNFAKRGELGLNGSVNEVQAGYQDEDAAYFLSDYGGPGLFIPVHISLHKFGTGAGNG